MLFELLTGIRVNLEPDHILKGQGIDPARASERLVETARETAGEINRLLEPAALIVTVRIRDFEHERVTFTGGCFEGPLVAQAMAGASEFTLALCTIGPRLEQQAAGLFSENGLKAVAIDGGGNAALEMMQLTVSGIITEQVKRRGLKTGMKISPGQEGWPIEQQRIVFNLLPADKLQVRLTESCLMLPRKSITFAIPAGSDMRSDAVPCDFCSKRENCRWRRKVGEHNPPPPIVNCSP